MLGGEMKNKSSVFLFNCFDSDKIDVFDHFYNFYILPSLKAMPYRKKRKVAQKISSDIMSKKKKMYKVTTNNDEILKIIKNCYVSLNKIDATFENNSSASATEKNTEELSQPKEPVEVEAVSSHKPVSIPVSLTTWFLNPHVVLKKIKVPVETVVQSDTLLKTVKKRELEKDETDIVDRVSNKKIKTSIENSVSKKPDLVESNESKKRRTKSTDTLKDDVSVEYPDVLKSTRIESNVGCSPISEKVNELPIIKDKNKSSLELIRLKYRSKLHKMKFVEKKIETGDDILQLNIDDEFISDNSPETMTGEEMTDNMTEKLTGRNQTKPEVSSENESDFKKQIVATEERKKQIDKLYEEEEDGEISSDETVIEDQLEASSVESTPVSVDKVNVIADGHGDKVNVKVEGPSDKVEVDNDNGDVFEGKLVVNSNNVDVEDTFEVDSNVVVKEKLVVNDNVEMTNDESASTVKHSTCYATVENNPKTECLVEKKNVYPTSSTPTLPTIESEDPPITEEFLTSFVRGICYAYQIFGVCNSSYLCTYSHKPQEMFEMKLSKASNRYIFRLVKMMRRRKHFTEVVYAGLELLIKRKVKESCERYVRMIFDLVEPDNKKFINFWHLSAKYLLPGEEPQLQFAALLKVVQSEKIGAKHKIVTLLWVLKSNFNLEINFKLVKSLLWLNLPPPILIEVVQNCNESVVDVNEIRDIVMPLIEIEKLPVVGVEVLMRFYNTLSFPDQKCMPNFVRNKLAKIVLKLGPDIDRRRFPVTYEFQRAVMLERGLTVRQSPVAGVTLGTKVSSPRVTRVRWDKVEKFEEIDVETARRLTRSGSVSGRGSGENKLAFARNLAHIPRITGRSEDASKFVGYGDRARSASVGPWSGDEVTRSARSRSVERVGYEDQMSLGRRPVDEIMRSTRSRSVGRVGYEDQMFLGRGPVDEIMRSTRSRSVGRVGYEDQMSLGRGPVDEIMRSTRSRSVGRVGYEDQMSLGLGPVDKMTRLTRSKRVGLALGDDTSSLRRSKSMERVGYEDVMPMCSRSASVGREISPVCRQTLSYDDLELEVDSGDVDLIKNYLQRKQFSSVRNLLNQVRVKDVEYFSKSILDLVTSDDLASLQNYCDLFRSLLSGECSEFASETVNSVLLNLIVSLFDNSMWDQAVQLLKLSTKYNVDLTKCLILNHENEFSVGLKLSELCFTVQDIHGTVYYLDKFNVFDEDRAGWRHSNFKAKRFLITQIMKYFIDNHDSGNALNIFIKQYQTQRRLIHTINLSEYINDLLTLLINENQAGVEQFYQNYLKSYQHINNHVVRGLLVYCVRHEHWQIAFEIFNKYSDSLYSMPPIEQNCQVVVKMLSYWLEEEVKLVLKSLFDKLCSFDIYHMFQVILDVSYCDLKLPQGQYPTLLSLIDCSVNGIKERIRRSLNDFKPKFSFTFSHNTIIIDQATLTLHLKERRQGNKRPV